MKEQILKFLEQTQVPAKTLGHGRIKNLMNRLGNPQDQLKIIHLAGTNGKGSVCAMLTSILMASGHKVGLFTSPHLIKYNERLQINRVPISDPAFEQIIQKVQAAYQSIIEDQEEAPIFFEVMTAMAFVYFAQEQVDLVILETGIGGRYDATNIIQKPLLSIITSIGKDHMDFLGDTTRSIAMEKGGIIKENCPTVLYHADKPVYNIIKDICQTKNSPLFLCQESMITQESYSQDGTRFSIQTQTATYDNIYMQLLGKYQVTNALTALMATECLRETGYPISKDHIYQGFKDVSWAGRMELIQKNPPIIIDGAHNEESAKAFAMALQSITDRPKVYMLIGVLKGKDYKTILDILVPFAHTIILTQTSDSRALPARDLYSQIKKMDNCPDLIIEEDFVRAYQRGKVLIEQGQAILCCLGSLYLVGEIKQFLQSQEEENVEF